MVFQALVIKMLELVFLGLICAFCNVQCSSTKLVYDWNVNSSSGSLLPSEHLSKVPIRGKIVIHSSDRAFLIQLQNVSTNDPDYNADLLYLPFAVDYGKNESILFSTDSKDELWSINMKRSIASLFQLNIDATNLREGAFVVSEESMYGKCEVEYVVTKISDDGYKVQKFMNEQSCTDLPVRFRSNTPFFSCPSTFQEGVATYNEKSYVISKGEEPIAKEITAFGTILFQPFQALAEAHYIYVNQVLSLSSMEQDNENLTFPTSLSANNITYVPELDHDPTSGCVPSNHTLLRAEIYSLLEILTESLNWELGTENLDNQTSYHILELMWWLDSDDWEEMYRTVVLGTSYTQETIRHFFWDLLPQVGSEASAMFIKKLVTTKAVKGFSAYLLLTTFPLHIRNPSDKFLKKFEDLLVLNDLEKEIKYAGLLGFATLVHRTCNDHCSVELVDRYTKFFLDKFMDSHSYEERMVYLQALSNMQLARILDFLSPVIISPSYNVHIRSLAIGSTISIMHKHPKTAVEIFWPMFLNRSEPLEIRIASFSMLMITQPSVSRLLTFYWYMISEHSYQLHNFFYTTVQSFANTKHPCYSEIKHAASQLSRYLRPRGYRWASGNYLLDYEDTQRGYGGLIHTVLIASEKTGLPKSVYTSMEQHSHGLSSRYSIYLKAQGFTDILKSNIFEVKYMEGLTKFANLSTIFQQLKMNHVTADEDVHFEIIVKVDGSTVYCKYLNETAVTNLISVVKQANALYYEFSINYQRLRFPLHYETVRLTDLGAPVALQIRTASVLSLRGSVKQAENGKIRQTDPDLRYSMDTVTSLKAYNPLSKEWHGADRTRSLHLRLPFSMHILEKLHSSIFQITANRHKDFTDGSLLGIVWHSTITLFPGRVDVPVKKANNHSPYRWSITSRDLGATLAAEIFDCQAENDIFNSLLVIKEAFQISNKNHNTVTGGALILGLYSLANYFTFLPPGDSCGIIISVAPLPVQVVLLKEGDKIHFSLMTEHENETIWNLTTHYQEKEDEGTTEINFELSHTATEEKNNEEFDNNSWRLGQFVGYFKIPSYKPGVLKAPGPAEGQGKVSWKHLDQETGIELVIHSDNIAKNWPLNCEYNTATCLQMASNLAALQTVSLHCINLPTWMTTALLSIFPDNVNADKTATNIYFTLPAKLPWINLGTCVVNVNNILTFDNGTILDFPPNGECYYVAVADCSTQSRFIVGLRKSEISNLMDMKIVYSEYDTLEITPTTEVNVTSGISINGIPVSVLQEYHEYPVFNDFVFRTKYWKDANMVEITISDTGLTLQYYGHTIVAIASSRLRGAVCGLCGDFNGETSNDGDTFSNTCVAF